MRSAHAGDATPMVCGEPDIISKAEVAGNFCEFLEQNLNNMRRYVLIWCIERRGLTFPFFCGLLSLRHVNILATGATEVAVTGRKRRGEGAVVAGR